MSKTVSEAYNYCRQELKNAGFEEYSENAREIMRLVTGFDSAKLVIKSEEKLNPLDEVMLNSFLERRKMHYPIQYLTGEWDFYGRNFKIGPGVLIPRADTEILVEKALEAVTDIKNPQILDLCAGSGCIGISLACERKDAQITMVEKYDDAMEYLNINLRKNGAENATALKGDIFESAAADRKYDLIVSNPPYITDSEMENLQAEVRFEPETALRAADEGLEFYRAITENYKNSLKPSGSICFEVGYRQAESVSEILNQAGFTKIGIKNDLNAVQRVVYGTLNSL